MDLCRWLAVGSRSNAGSTIPSIKGRTHHRDPAEGRSAGHHSSNTRAHSHSHNTIYTDLTHNPHNHIFLPGPTLHDHIALLTMMQVEPSKHGPIIHPTVQNHRCIGLPRSHDINPVIVRCITHLALLITPPTSSLHPHTLPHRPCIAQPRQPFFTKGL